VEQSQRDPKKILQAAYSRILIPDAETGTYTAQVQEFPGCVAQGDSPQEAYERLERAAESWLQAAIDLGQTIPEPAVLQQHSGRLLIRLPRSLHRSAAQSAEREGTSLNQFIVATLAEKVGAVNVYDRLARELVLLRAGTEVALAGAFKMKTLPVGTLAGAEQWVVTFTEVQ